MSIYSSNHTGHRHMRTMLVGTALCSLLASGAVHAQATAADEEPATDIVVTGTRLISPGLQSAAPISVTSYEEIKTQAVVNAEALIRDLPSATPGRSAATNNNGNGNTTINLRNLGDQRTLVLIDGKRLPAVDFSGVPDANTVPVNMIKRVEVQTGGSSAVYGSDAIAGVVNFILRQDFEGIEIDAQNSLYGAGDGYSFDANLMFGVNSGDGRGNITAYAGYTDRNPILASARDFSRTIFTSNGTSLIPTGSGVITAGRDLDRGLMFNANRQLVPYDGSRFNNNANRYLIVPQQRYLLGAVGHYDVASAFAPYFRVSFSQNKVDRQLGEPGFAGVVDVNYGNPFLSSQARGILFGPGVFGPNDVASINLGRRFIESGFIQERNNYQQFQIVIGAKGELGSGFSYDVSGQYGHVDWTQRLLGDFSFNRVQQALLVNPNGSCIDPSGGCVPLDIFTTAPGAVSGAAANFVALEQQANSESSQYVVTGSLSGDLGKVGIRSPWAEDGVAIAIGAEYRRESASYRPDDNLAVGNNVVFGAIPATSGRISTHDLFVEANAPIAQDAPFMHLLAINGGYRRSDYNLAGKVSAYKYGAVWAPIEDIRFRGSFQRAVRAPNIGELFAPAQPSADIALDPCFASETSAATAASALCRATGVPVANYGNINFQCFSTQCTTLVGGNRRLRPEKSDTISFGVVLQPRILRGLSATIDYYDIKLDGAIAPFGASAQNIFDNCYGTGAGQNPTQDAANIYCQQIVRDDSGRASGGGRLSKADGYISLLNSNIGFLRTKGIDAELAYRGRFDDLGLGLPGRFSLSVMATHVRTYDQKLNLDSPVQQCAGTYGFVCGQPNPKWRINTRFSWSPNDDVQITARWRYVGAVTLDVDSFSGTVSDAVAHRIGSESYLDLTAQFDIAKAFALRAGVINLTGNGPPVVPNTAAGANNRGLSNTFLGTYDLGRQLFVGLTTRF